MSILEGQAIKASWVIVTNVGLVDSGSYRSTPGTRQAFFEHEIGDGQLIDACPARSWRRPSSSSS
jgi:hypothetical protein